MNALVKGSADLGKFVPHAPVPGSVVPGVLADSKEDSASRLSSKERRLAPTLKQEALTSWRTMHATCCRP